MRRVVGYLAIWCGATALSICLAWFGVRDVLRAEVTDAPYPGLPAAEARTGRPPTPAATGPPVSPVATPSPRPRRARPARRPTAASSPAVPPPATATARPAATRRPTPARTSASPRATAARTTPAATRRPPGSRPSAEVKVVNVKGGQVSFAIENGECRLMSATPAAGYEARVSGNVGWIRVDLMKGEHGSSVFCTWHGHEPATDVWEY
ncbi:MAG: hypothetical protein DIU60_015260 [Actinomycetes bacterium]